MGNLKVPRIVYLSVKDDEKVRLLALKETNGELSAMLRKLVKEALEARER